MTNDSLPELDQLLGLVKFHDSYLIESPLEHIMVRFVVSDFHVGASLSHQLGWLLREIFETISGLENEDFLPYKAQIEVLTSEELKKIDQRISDQEIYANNLRIRMVEMIGKVPESQEYLKIFIAKSIRFIAIARCTDRALPELPMEFYRSLGGEFPSQGTTNHFAPDTDPRTKNALGITPGHQSNSI